MKLRLLLFKNCNRRCKGCCNKDWDLDALEVENDFSGYSEVLMTGGEPMLAPEIVIGTAMKIREQNPNAKIYVYTAKVDSLVDVFAVLGFVDGMCVTLHKQKDTISFERLNEALYLTGVKKSLRLNVFKGITLPFTSYDLWERKLDMEWVKNCPLPEDEVFKRL